MGEGNMPAATASSLATPDTVSSSGSAARPWASIAIETDIVALAETWRAFEPTALATPYQSYDWIRPFAETIGAAHAMTLRYALVRDAEGALCALLPLAVTGRNGFRFAEFIGGKHANYHMGLYAPAFATPSAGSTRWPSSTSRSHGKASPTRPRCSPPARVPAAPTSLP
jgi:CelD/BcsL family acetyltransferase involved in cellulose biosynthesis